MDLLTHLSVRYTDESRDDEDEEDPSDSGDNLVSMLLKPSYTTQESEKGQPNGRIYDDDE